MGPTASPTLPGLDLDLSGVVPDALPLTATERTFSMASSPLIGPLTFFGPEPKRAPIVNTQMWGSPSAQLKVFFDDVNHLDETDILTAQGDNG